MVVPIATFTHQQTYPRGPASQHSISGVIISNREHCRTHMAFAEGKILGMSLKLTFVHPVDLTGLTLVVVCAIIGRRVGRTYIFWENGEEARCSAGVSW